MLHILLQKQAPPLVSYITHSAVATNNMAKLLQ